ncbi:Acetyltransferase (GNAT)-like protein 8 [Elsinoe fawcettii]|nr:Acetyltransferase (GNAT)-like protein 8 [Elsinoe fawcettii]
MSNHPSFTIHPVSTPPDISATASLFQAYATWLSIDLTYQDFSTELASLPGSYAPPSGRLFLARDNESQEPLGCVAIRKLSGADVPTCEMKRFYVVPEARGRGVGKALLLAAVRGAREAGYVCVKLDTLVEKMQGAIRMYKTLGFVECERYYASAVEGTMFLSLDLSGRDV